jgi:hypothetical protein
MAEAQITPQNSLSLNSKMERPSPSHNGENWRWLHELERPSPNFWALLPRLGQTPFEIQHMAATYRGTIHLERLFLNDSGYLLASQPSLNIKESLVDKIYICENNEHSGESLEVDFFCRTSRLLLPEPNGEALKLLTTLFGWEMKPEDDALFSHRKLVAPPICRCCQGATSLRRENAPRNPLVSILRDLIAANATIAFSVVTPGMQMVVNHRPHQVFVDSGSIISRSEEDEFIIDAGRIHGLTVNAVRFDNEDYALLSLLDTFGVTFARVSAPLTLVSNSGRTHLASPDGDYEIV